MAKPDSDQKTKFNELGLGQRTFVADMTRVLCHALNQAAGIPAQGDSEAMKVVLGKHTFGISMDAGGKHMLLNGVTKDPLVVASMGRKYRKQVDQVNEAAHIIAFAVGPKL